VKLILEEWNKVENMDILFASVFPLLGFKDLSALIKRAYALAYMPGVGFDYMIQVSDVWMIDAIN
jgi:hypothetical protein